MDPDRYQMKDIKRRITALEKQRSRDLVKLRWLDREVAQLRKWRSLWEGEQG